MTVALIAAVGFVVNLVSFLLLRAGSKHSLNVRGAFLEVLADMLGSLGVVLAGVIQATTGWPYADPIIAALIGLVVLPRTLRLMRQAVRILMEVAPPGCDVAHAEARLAALPGVTSVHDLHIWTVTDGIESASAHVVVAAGADWHACSTRPDRSWSRSTAVAEVLRGDIRNPFVMEDARQAGGCAVVTGARALGHCRTARVSLTPPRYATSFAPSRSRSSLTSTTGSRDRSAEPGQMIPWRQKGCEVHCGFEL